MRQLFLTAAVISVLAPLTVTAQTTKQTNSFVVAFSASTKMHLTTTGTTGSGALTTGTAMYPMTVTSIATSGNYVTLLGTIQSGTTKGNYKLSIDRTNGNANWTVPTSGTNLNGKVTSAAPARPANGANQQSTSNLLVTVSFPTGSNIQLTTIGGTGSGAMTYGTNVRYHMTVTSTTTTGNTVTLSGRIEAPSSTAEYQLSINRQTGVAQGSIPVWGVEATGKGTVVLNASGNGAGVTTP